jgi:hypothetical protein
MKNWTSFLFAGIAVFGFGTFVLQARTADEKGLAGDVQKVADALTKGKADEAKKAAEDVAKATSDFEDVMNLMALRKPGGKKAAFGFGDPAGANKPDGIEAKLIGLSKKPLSGSQASKESPDIAKMAYRVQAIALIARAKAPEKDEGAKKKKDWQQWTDDLEKGAEKLADAAKEKKAAGIKTAATNLNKSCNNCHEVFRN